MTNGAITVTTKSGQVIPIGTAGARQIQQASISSGRGYTPRVAMAGAPAPAPIAPASSQIQSLASEKGLGTVTRGGVTYLSGVSGIKYAKEQGLPYITPAGEIQKQVAGETFLLRGGTFTPETTYRIPAEVKSEIKRIDPTSAIIRDKEGHETVITRSSKAAEYASDQGAKARVQLYAAGGLQETTYTPLTVGKTTKEIQAQKTLEDIAAKGVTITPSFEKYVKQQLEQGKETVEYSTTQAEGKTVGLTPSDVQNITKLGAGTAYIQQIVSKPTQIDTSKGIAVPFPFAPANLQKFIGTIEPGAIKLLEKEYLAEQRREAVAQEKVMKEPIQVFAGMTLKDPTTVIEAGAIAAYELLSPTGEMREVKYGFTPLLPGAQLRY